MHVFICVFMTPIILPRHTQGYCVKDRVEWVVAVVMGAEVGGGGGGC